jgi:PAS domain S-box-containing protein
MHKEKIEILERALKREKAARKQAEKILEDKSRDLYLLSDKLKNTNEQLENLLQEKSSQLQGVFENINDAYLIIDLDGNVINMNNVAIDLFGYDIEKENLNVAQLIYVKDIEYAYNSFNTLIELGIFSNYIARIYTKKKLVRWVQINATIIFDTDKKPIAAQGIIRDITLEKESEDLLLESKNRLASLILNLDSGVLLEDENRKIVLTNTKFCELFKIPVSPELLIGNDCTNAAKDTKGLFKNPDDFINRINEILVNKKEVIGDEVIMQDGTILERNFIPVLNGNQYKGHLWTYRDVTLKRQYRKSLESQKQKYSSIIANMNLGLVEVNMNDEILMVNQSFTKLSGYKEKELIGKKGGEVFLAKSNSIVIKKEQEKRENGQSNSYELEVKNKKGEIRHWLVSGAPNYNIRGEVTGSIGIHLDITEFKKLETQKEKILKELEKSNNELHEYAHIVSHDLKSPLRSIDALVSWIKSDNIGKLDATTVENFTLIEDTLEIMEKLISNILEYSSAGADTKEENVDLNETITALKKALFVPENIAIDVTNKLPIVNGDKTKFQQLFQNLISNAIKFSDKEKGLIQIEFVDKISFYQFAVRDNGIGIEEKYHDKIFKIFHSLNKSKESTGIGLSIVRKIIDLYEGSIWLESVPKKGTTFYFTIKKNR